MKIQRRAGLSVGLSVLLAFLALLMMTKANSFKVITDGKEFFFIGPGSSGQFGEFQTRGQNSETNFPRDDGQ